MPTKRRKQPRPDLQALFAHYNALYFQQRIDDCKVEWSSDRMTSCAGYCRRREDKGCVVRISEPLHKLRSPDDVKNTLLHEMIHASMLLNQTDDRDGHGQEFKDMMLYINESTVPDEHRPDDGYNVTVYHDFREESDYYKKHGWRCEKCGAEVKRAVNRKPQEADCAKMNIRNGICRDAYCPWHQHLKQCGGQYIKVCGAVQKPILSTLGTPLKKRRKNQPMRYSLSVEQKAETWAGRTRQRCNENATEMPPKEGQSRRS